ncbi:hypothetical protein VNI00_006611 [Paramarasmius palmivorus]|uniref:Pectate lyase domain-containing protein n=1 Tax=Paramarasmius palmivorus TaxID=297713 RepID=A0AAW0D724_9AGAR
MKWFSTIVAFIAIQAVVASPARLLKRASPDETASVGYAAGTTGGSGGTTINVSSLSELEDAVSGDEKRIVIVNGAISGDAVVRIGSNKSVLGAPGASLTGIGLRVLDVSNVIIRNLKISKVLAPGDNIGIQSASNVWVDHVELSSDLDHDKLLCLTHERCGVKSTIPSYDGLLDVTHGCTGVTVSNSYLHDHYKASLVGHSDSNQSEDVAIRVTYVGNYWKNLNSRTPSFRFGTGHIYNNYFESNNDGINTRVGAQLLVENNVWVSPKKPLYSTGEGYAVARGNDFGGGENTAPAGSFSSAPYSYGLLDTSQVVSSVTSQAGATLSW